MTVERREDLSALLGETLDVVIPLFSDEEGLVPRDLSGSIVEVTLMPYNLGEDAPVVLTLAQGLTVEGEHHNQVRIVKAINSGLFDVGLGRWSMKVVDAAGKVDFPKAGRLTVGKP